MGQQRVNAALDRIEKALSRIEAAAAAAAAVDGGDAAVRQAHLRLRGRVETAIGQIDRLLESEELH
jgi:hypothetical protein